MKYAAKYFRANDDTWEYYHNKYVIQRQCQQTLKTEEVEELCSIPNIPNKDNCALFENAELFRLHGIEHNSSVPPASKVC